MTRFHRNLLHFIYLLNLGIVAAIVLALLGGVR